MNIVIVGLGVIGGSFGLALKDLGYADVHGIDTNEETLKKAREMGIIQNGCTHGRELLTEADLVILAIYPKLVRNFIEENKDRFKKGAVLTDTTGVKGAFIDDVLAILPEHIDFVFGHPMAGREKKGIEFATNTVFQRANYILTPTEKNKEENLKMIEDLVLAIGFRRVRRITPELHDELISFTSQLPHAMAVALMNSDIEGRDTGSFIGDSYRDLTRIANMNEDLWSELFLENRNNLLRSIIKFDNQLNQIKDAILENDAERLKEYFRESTRRREKLDV